MTRSIIEAKDGFLAQLARARDSHSRGHRFESCRTYHSTLRLRRIARLSTLSLEFGARDRGVVNHIYDREKVCTKTGPD